MKFNTSLVLIAVYFFGLYISLDALYLRDLEGHNDRHNIVPQSIVNLKTNIFDFGLEKGLTEPHLIEESADLDELPYYMAAGLNAIDLFKNANADAGRTFLFNSLKAKTIDKPELYTEQVIREHFGGDPNTLIECINAVVDLFSNDVEAELAE